MQLLGNVFFFYGSSLGTKILFALFFFKEQSKFLILLLLRRAARRQERKCCKLKPNTNNQIWMCLCTWGILGVFLRFWRLDPGLSLVAGFELLSCTAFIPGKLTLLAGQHPCLGAALPCCCCAPSARHWDDPRGPQQFWCAGSGTCMSTARQGAGWLAWEEWGSSPAQICSFTCSPPAPCKQRTELSGSSSQVWCLVSQCQFRDSPTITLFLMPCCSCSPGRDSRVWANCFFFWV